MRSREMSPRNHNGHQRIGTIVTAEVPPLSDEQIQALMQTDDPTMLNQAVIGIQSKYGKGARSIAYQITTNAEDSDEIVNTALEKTWKKRDQFISTKGRFSAWFFRIVANEAKDKKRKKKYRGEYTQKSLEDDEYRDAMRDTLQDPDSETDPQERALKTELREEVGSAMNKLSQIDQQILRLFYFEGYTLDQISQLVGRPRPNVNSRLQDARRKLERELIKQKEQMIYRRER